MPREIRSMTVQQLMDYLSQFGPEDEVFIQVPSNDYWGHELAKPIRKVDYAEIKWSEYHEAMKLTDEMGEENRTVIVIGESEY